MNMNLIDKRLVVDANPFRTRVALLENNTVAEIYIELRSRSGLIGNIYKGRVQKVLPGMAAAFIDIGTGKNVFLGMDDIIETPGMCNGEFTDAIRNDGEKDCTQQTEFRKNETEKAGTEKTEMGKAETEKAETGKAGTGKAETEKAETGKAETEKAEAGQRNKKPIKPMIKNGQTVMVQIVKEAFGTKSERASMRISLPGHTLVFMPADNFTGISKRITDEKERKRLKRIARECCPEGTGVIMRTAASEYDEETIKRDLMSLVEKWNKISSAYTAAKAPELIYQEESLITRTVRDLMKGDIGHLTVNDTEQYKALIGIAEETDPSLCERIELKADEHNLFEALGIEAQIDAALARRVWLKSGAYLIIDQTEAFVTIDVNTGKNTGNIDLRQTIVETNCEAAVEIAHQLRLRNLSGMIIIDFIDMENKTDRETVIAALRDAAKRDRIYSVIIDMTELGLVVVTRKKLRANLSSALQNNCPYCGGSGKVLTAESVALKLREAVLYRCRGNGVKNMQVTANPKVIEIIKAYYEEEKGLNDALAETRIAWKADPHIHVEKYIIKNEV